ncbi:kelch repeat and BTB domain-containing protein 2-like [Branchiostoma floridae]|uniref:Kelch repeat and BTB domain-containing protein 2-like n=1 Tax=Branchiostoma floridae TaxID=7739 RepID=A0A9J7L6Y3_BRAFL|nr:kelch repeat and BTB domain-containing protein 2-like [Branchiostoma floridae]
MFGEILSYIYSGILHVSLDKVQPLYQAADLLQLDYVRDTCSSYMAMNVECSTCVDLYKFADVFSLDIVRKTCLKLIHRYFVEFSFNEEFCSLSVSQLTEIISHDELDVKEETTVWEVVVRWVQHSREDRLHRLPSILSHIRFNLLTSDDTAAILEHPFVRENPGSSEVIRNVVQKGNPNLKPRLGMTTEMAILSNSESKELLFMNPQEGKYISCNYKPEDLPGDTDVTVTSDNNIYILSRERESNDELSLFKYSHAENVWKDAAIGYTSLGCWADDISDRAIPTLEGTDSRLDGHYSSRENPIEKCYQVALSRGFPVFAVQNGGWCAGSADGLNTYYKYGASPACAADGGGGDLANEVYGITETHSLTIKTSAAAASGSNDSLTMEIFSLNNWNDTVVTMVSGLTANG